MAGADLVPLLDRRAAGLRAARPDLDAAVDVQTTLLRLALGGDREPDAPPFALPRARAAAQVRSGTPLLHGAPISLDLHFAADLFSRLVNALGERGDAALAARLDPLVSAATGGALDPERLFTEAFVQHADHLADLAHACGVDADLLTTLAGQAVAPLLRAYAARLLPQVAAVDDGSPDGAAWERGYCPVCGGWPLLGELRGVELAQYLRCAACGAAWRWPRLACPFCATDDHRLLRSLRVEGEKRFRISACDHCRGYLKVGTAFDPPPPELLPLDDLASVHLDVAALEHDYHRPAGSGFRLEVDLPGSALDELDEMGADLD